MNKIIVAIALFFLFPTVAEAQIGPNWAFRPQPRIWIQRPVVKKRRFGRVVMPRICNSVSPVRFREAAFNE